MTAGARGPGTALIGWQTLLADLSLILFMVTAAAMAGDRGHGSRVNSVGQMVSATPEAPLAVWRAGDTQTLRQWLSIQQRDDRQQLTITMHYRGGAAHATAAAQALVSEAGAVGANARVIVTPVGAAESERTLASLAYDRAP